jgi:HD-like signal output (HDOD) protein
MAALFESDKKLSLRILESLKTSIFGPPENISSIKIALRILGLSRLKNIALAFIVFELFSSHKRKWINYSDFITESLFGGSINSLIAEKLSIHDGGSSFLLGFIQNIGQLIIADHTHFNYNAISEECCKNNSLLWEAEDSFLGFNHMDVGELALTTWGFPENQSVPIGYHHLPNEVTPKPTESDPVGCELPQKTKVLYLSSLFVDLFSGLCEKSIVVEKINLTLRELNLNNQIQISSLMENSLKLTKDLMPLFQA